jgi:hypothetical protein
MAIEGLSDVLSPAPVGRAEEDEWAIDVGLDEVVGAQNQLDRIASAINVSVKRRMAIGVIPDEMPEALDLGKQGWRLLGVLTHHKECCGDFLVTQILSKFERVGPNTYPWSLGRAIIECQAERSSGKVGSGDSVPMPSIHKEGLCVLGNGTLLSKLDARALELEGQVQLNHRPRDEPRRFRSP